MWFFFLFVHWGAPRADPHSCVAPPRAPFAWSGRAGACHAFRRRRNMMALELITSQFEWGPAPGAGGTRQAGLTADPNSLLSQPAKLLGSFGRPRWLAASLSWGSWAGSCQDSNARSGSLDRVVAPRMRSCDPSFATPHSFVLRAVAEPCGGPTFEP